MAPKHPFHPSSSESQQPTAVPAPTPIDGEFDNPFRRTLRVWMPFLLVVTRGFRSDASWAPIVIERPVRGLQGAFVSLDGVDLKDRFKFRVCVMRTVPYFMKGAFWLGLRAALEEVLAGCTGQWSQLLERSLSNDEQAHHVSSRRRRHQTDSVEKRAERARNLVHFGELSAARIALRHIGDIERVDES